MTLFSYQPAFAGMSEYMDALPGQVQHEDLSRIYVKFKVAEESHLALLDSGAHYCIFARDIVDKIRHELTVPLGWRTFQTAFGQIRGQLYPYTISLISWEGEPLDVEVIALVCRDWQGPTYFGYTGVLDRIQWAVHPARNGFFFGSLD